MLQHVFSYCFYFLSYVYLIVQMEMECNHARIIYGSYVHLIRMFHFKISTQLKGSNNNNKWKVSLYSLMNALPFLKELQFNQWQAGIKSAEMLFIERYIFSTDITFMSIFLILLETFYMLNVLLKQGKWILKTCYCPNMQTCYCPNMLLYQLVNFLEPDTKKVPSNKACTDLLLK